MRKESIEVFPNPANTELRLRQGFREKPDEYNVTIYNMQGKAVKNYTAKFPETILDISQLLPGVYCLKIQGNGVCRTERVVKE